VWREDWEARAGDQKYFTFSSVKDNTPSLCTTRLALVAASDRVDSSEVKPPIKEGANPPYIPDSVPPQHCMTG